MTQSEPAYQYLGKPRKLVEGLEKVTGRARYSGDVSLPDMAYARPILSPYAHARIVAIDAEAARRMPGVIAVLTAEDLPTRDRLITSRSSAVLAKERVLFRGQPVAVVVGETEAAAQDGADAVQIDYDPLPAVVDLVRAAADDAPVIWPDGLPREGADLSAAHAAVDKETVTDDRGPSNVHAENHYKRGDVAQGFREAEIVIERVYKTPLIHQSYMEPHASVAEPDLLRGGVRIYTSTQGQFIVRDEVARLLSLPKSKVRVTPMTVGGGFGAKYGTIDPLVAAVALTLRRPIRMTLTRTEDFLTTTPSPASVMDLKVGASKDGRITAIQARLLMDNGIFPFTVGGIAGVLLGGYYKCANVQIDCLEVITNKPQAGAYRAPGAPIATFALESTIDDLARALDLDPLDFRLRNAAETGDPMGNGDPWPSMGLKLCLERLRDHPAWRDRSRRPNEGVGIAVGGWPCFMSPAAAVCRMDSDGSVRIHVGSIDISGVNSSFALVAAEVLGISPDQVEIIQGDTRSGLFSGPSGGSQTIYSVAPAVAAAANEVKQQLLRLAEDHFEARLEDLELKDGKVQVKGVPDRAVALSELVERAESKNDGPGPLLGEARVTVDENAPGFVAHLVKVAVDRETGVVTPLRYVAVQDVGFALNPMMVEGQIQGGSVQGLGWGLHEAMVYDEYGQLLTATFMDYDVPKPDTTPPIEVSLVQNPSPRGPFGARGVGEPPITAGAAAIGNAINDATGVRVTELPIRPEALWRALQRDGRNS